MVAQINAGEQSIAGVMLESYIKQGNQPINADHGKMIPGLSLTDACLGWQETEATIMEAYKNLKI